jgi:hypothetical protein
MYGLYTDIPMTYLLIAPYIEPFSETPDENGLIRSKYWEECGFKTAEDSALPTFLEFLEKYKTVLLQLQSNQINLGTESEEYANLQGFVASLNEIKQHTERLFNSVEATNGSIHPNKTFKPYDNTNNEYSKNWYKLFTKSNDEEITLKWDNTIASELHKKITDINSDYAGLLGTTEISQNLITVCYNRTDGEVTNTMRLSTTLLDATNEISFSTNNTSVTLSDITENDKTFLSQDISEEDKGTHYIFGMNIHQITEDLNGLIRTTNETLRELYDAATENAAQVFEDAMGFRMSIENIYRMVFAHLQCFFHEYIDNTITEIATDTSVKRLIESDFGISLEDTDIDSKDENPKAPPFFALYEGQDEQKTIAYPGTTIYGKPELRTIHEVALVEKLLNAAKLYRENFDAIRNRIEGLTLELNSGEESTSFTTNPEAITTFNPICVYEVLFGNTNPYSHLDNDAKIEDILYHAGLRLYIAERLGYIKSFALHEVYAGSVPNWNRINQGIIDLEVKNIAKVFPTLDMTNYTDSGFDDIVKDKIFNYDYMYKCLSDEDFEFRLNILATSQFNTMDTSLTIDNILNEREKQIIRYLDEMVLFYDDGGNVFDMFRRTFNNQIKDAILSPVVAFICFDTTDVIRDATKKISKCALNKLYTTTEETSGNKTITKYSSGDDQLPRDSHDKYTVPFLVWNSGGDLINMLESPSFQTIERDVQAFFILLSLVVSELSELMPKAYELAGVFDHSTSQINYDRISRCSCLKVRFVTALFLGAVEYVYSNPIPERFVKYGILIDDGTGTGTYKLNRNLIKNDTYSDIVVRTFKSEEKGANWEHSPLTFKNTPTFPSTIDYIDKFYSTFLKHDTILTNLFIENVYTQTNNLLSIILDNFKKDIDTNSFNFDKDKYKIDLRNGFDSYGESAFMGEDEKPPMKFLVKGCDTDKNLVELLSKTSTLIFTDAYTNQDASHTIKSSITDLSSFKTYFKEAYIIPIKEKLKDEVGEPTNNTETRHNSPSNIAAGESNDLKKSLYYTLKNLYDKWVCSYGNMNRFKLPSTYQEEKNNKEKKYVNGEKVDSISEINNFIFVDGFYRDISNDFLVNPDTIVEIIEQTLLSRQFNFSMYQFMALLCEKNKLLFRALPVYNNFTDTDSLKNIFRPNNLFNHQTPQENNFSPTYLIMYTHQPSAHLNISTKKGINYRDDGFDLAGTIAPKQFESCDDGEHINYKVPAFGVTYGMQNQNYFKSININMDNPITTDYAILNQIQLAERAVSGDLQHPIGIGQNIYSIYSNRSYTCTVEMLGCANIMPMMYFQLNNIPMFKGAYMIVSVKHSIKNGSMTTIFTGVRQSSALQAFTTESYLLSRIVDATTSGGGNNTVSSGTDCGTYDMSWADNETL